MTVGDDIMMSLIVKIMIVTMIKNKIKQGI